MRLFYCPKSHHSRLTWALLFGRSSFLVALQPRAPKRRVIKVLSGHWTVDTLPSLHCTTKPTLSQPAYMLNSIALSSQVAYAALWH